MATPALVHVKVQKSGPVLTKAELEKKVEIILEEFKDSEEDSEAIKCLEGMIKVKDVKEVKREGGEDEKGERVKA